MHIHKKALSIYSNHIIFITCLLQDLLHYTAVIHQNIQSMYITIDIISTT